MKSTITIRLDADLEKLLDEVAQRSGRNRSDIIRDALRRQLSLLTFDRLRERVMPFAEARGYLGSTTFNRGQLCQSRNGGLHRQLKILNHD